MTQPEDQMLLEASSWLPQLGRANYASVQQQVTQRPSYVLDSDAGAGTGYQQQQQQQAAANEGYFALPQQQQQPQYMAAGQSLSTNDQSSSLPLLLVEPQLLPQQQAKQWAQIVTGQRPPPPPPRESAMFADASDPAAVPIVVPPGSSMAMYVNGAPLPPGETDAHAAVVAAGGMAEDAHAATTMGADIVALAVVPGVPLSSALPPASGIAGRGVSDAMSLSLLNVLDRLDNFKDTWDPYETTNIPMFWHN
jgi:hypothetical protein